MDRRRANKSINSGLVAAGIALAIFALTFYAAVLYVGG
jgi:hypothetical protein